MPRRHSRNKTYHSLDKSDSSTEDENVKNIRKQHYGHGLYKTKHDDEDSDQEALISQDTDSDEETSKKSSSEKQKRRKRRIMVMVALGVIIIILFVLVMVFYVKLKNKESSGSGGGSSSAVPTGSPPTSGGSSNENTGTDDIAGTRTVTFTSATATSEIYTTVTDSEGTTPTKGPAPAPTDQFSFSGTFPGLSKNGMGVGFVPDYDDKKLTELNDILGIKFSFYGWYAQVGDGPWDGAQLLPMLEDVKKSGAIFQPAVMPSKGWNGLKKNDNSLALDIAKVMKQFTDEGIEVWLRFAHEINWYLEPGSAYDESDKSRPEYPGGIDDFKEGWQVVAEAVRDNPMVKMWYTPNNANMDQYTRFYPDDPKTVDIIGVDYYPENEEGNAFDFIGRMKPFYDQYCGTKDGHTTMFAIGETGLHYDADISVKLRWLQNTLNETVKEQMPLHLGTAWFNYAKEGHDYRIWVDGNETMIDTTKAWLQADTVPSGVSWPNGV